MLNTDRTLDEFAVPEEAQEMITQHRPQIEQLFGVELNILGVLESAESSRQEPQGARNIWLQLQGCRENLQRAKEYIKGLCTPELSEEVHYPKDMQCIFLGAHGLFLDCLTKGTSANLTSLRPGSLLISGLAESFVMAQSRIQEFVEKHQKNPKLPDEREAQVKRAFRELVEMYDDKHTIDLLILPTSVKEELLNLVKEIQQEDGEQRQKNGCCLKPGFGNKSWKSEAAGGGGRPWSPHKSQNIFGLSTGFSRVQDQSRTRESSGDLPLGFSVRQEYPHKSQPSVYSPFSIGPQDIRTHLPQDQSLPAVSEVDFSGGLDETKMLIGPQDLVCNLAHSLGQPEANTPVKPVIPRSSPKLIPARKAEVSKTWFLPGYEGLVHSSEDHQEEQRTGCCARESSPVSLPEETSEEEASSEVLLSSYTEKEFKMMLNFFKTMGYEEEIIKKILLEGGVRETPSTILDRVQMAQAGLSQKESMVLPQNEPGEIELPPSPPQQTSQDEDDYFRELIKTAMASCGHSPSQIPAEIHTGVPLAGLLRQLNEKGEHQDEAESTSAIGASAAKPEYGEQLDIKRTTILNHGESSQFRTLQERGRHSGSPLFEGNIITSVNPEVSPFLPAASPSSTFLSTLNSERSQSAESTRLGPAQQSSIPTVTGAQRFEEALQTEFKLKLANTPGKKNLRMIIIDGSNVAMMHGLNQFFSCRGIALAVQYFWDRGHRDVTVLVPAHRLEEDSNVRERHFLVELHNLSILSLTPSRKIDGKGIVPYDDRFMLQLAEKTNGVIVTNDQFRDLAKESKKWVKIIKESLLQYIFVGNIFMVPDDPLGRDGPTLAEFLKKKLRTSSPNCHTFSGRPVPSPSPTPVRPASQTEVLQLRERRPPGRLAGNRWTNPQDYEAGEVRRTAEETERLRKDLLEIFVGQDQKVDFVLMREPCCLDLNKLSEAILSLNF